MNFKVPQSLYSIDWTHRLLVSAGYLDQIASPVLLLGMLSNRTQAVTLIFLPDRHF